MSPLSSHPYRCPLAPSNGRPPAGMALVWRLSTRRAGRRTLAAAGGAACLWLLAVLLLPVVLPPSNAPHEAQLPAQRRIHQQQVDAADYTGGKTARRSAPGRMKDGSQQQEPSLRGIRPGLRNVRADHQSRNLINAANEDRSFLLTERGSGVGADTVNKEDGYVANELVQLPDVSPVGAVPEANAPSISESDDTVSPEISTDGVNVQNNDIIFAPIESDPAISESQNNPFLGDDPDIALVPPQEGGERLDPKGRPSAPVAVISGTSSQADTMASSRTNAAVQGKLHQETWVGREATADISEGPYTLPILKTPKDSAPAPPKVSYWEFSLRIWDILFVRRARRERISEARD